jgi:hypothetical protein
LEAHAGRYGAAVLSPENRERIGKGNPPKHTRFKPGQSGNPGGVSSERKRLLNEAAERAARIMARQLEALEGLMNEHPEKERIVSELITADIHRIVKDALDRVDGTPRQSVDMTSSDGSMSPPSRIVIEAAHADDGSED